MAQYRVFVAAIWAFAAIIGGSAGSQQAMAAESGFSNFLQGGYGDFAVAVAPEPGWYLRNDLFLFSGDAQATTTDGSQTLQADASAELNYLSAAFVGKETLFGGRFSAGAYLPLNIVDADVLQTTSAGTFDIGSRDTGVGDAVVIPASLYWSHGNFHVNVYEAITVPSARYVGEKTANTGRGVWSFDTIAAVTHLDLERGIELSAVGGFLINSVNKETDYRTGIEVHGHVMLNKLLTPTFAVGIHGYHYQQVTGDSGSGAVFGDFKSRSTGVGPALLWQPKSAAGKVSLIAKWLHDVDGANRFTGDQVVFSVVKKH